MGEATLNLHVDDYTNRVLGVIKEMFGLRDKSEALQKFAHIYGEEYVDKEVNDEIAKKIVRITEEHIKKHGMRKMTIKQLDELTGL